MMDKQMMLKSRKQKKEEDALTGCLLVIAIPVVIFALAVMFDDVSNSISPSSSNKSHSDWAPPIERRTRVGIAIEKGADIDYRIDSDKIIDLSVSAIRSKGYSCNSLSSIHLYTRPDRIQVNCNGGMNKYRIQKDSAGLFRQVMRR